MSVNGVTGGAASLLRPYEGVRPKADQEKPTAAAQQSQQVARPGPSRTLLLAPRQEALPAEAPAGTDPELWQVLTADERAFFSRMTSMGPLTYGRQSIPTASATGRAAEAPLARGGRIDVKA